jgi:hypothetical protein
MQSLIFQCLALYTATDDPVTLTDSSVVFGIQWPNYCHLVSHNSNSIRPCRVATTVNWMEIFIYVTPNIVTFFRARSFKATEVESSNFLRSLLIFRLSPGGILSFLCFHGKCSDNVST